MNSFSWIHKNLSYIPNCCLNKWKRNRLDSYISPNYCFIVSIKGGVELPPWSQFAVSHSEEGSGQLWQSVKSSRWSPCLGCVGANTNWHTENLVNYHCICPPFVHHCPFSTPRVVSCQGLIVNQVGKARHLRQLAIHSAGGRTSLEHSPQQVNPKPCSRAARHLRYFAQNIGK